MRSLILSLILSFAALSGVAAQEAGDPHAGAADEDASPVPTAPRFKSVANATGLTATALRFWLQNPHHPTMPDIILKPHDLSNVVAYILGQKD